ncbi:solute carrier family 12 member 8-like [Diadema antillarum]|uniref:solute carrier family 12 member 8-like n=1 Tax=Diadema antillarum TaxID=105358 RepID=UPI003A856535
MADDYNGGTGGEGSEKLIGDPSPTADNKAGGKKEIDWGRFGLSEESHAKNYSDNTLTGYGGESGYQQGESGQKIQELFDEQQAGQSSHSQTPWWKANFFVREPVLFGTWDGVFTSCMINIFGVVIFLRTGWMVGNAGVGLSVLIILMTVTVALISSLAAIGVCERCKMESGGIYFLLSHVLGARMGATLGILYSFGQTVACALYCTGFGESVAEMFHWTNPWAVRGVGIAVILLLLAINIAGVKWVIKMQLLLLAVLGVATLDFLVGTVAHTDKDDGFMGYNRTVFKNNSAADYLPGENFFTVFGVFFPTATGVMAGINMSGDLRDARKSIPEGTLSALGVTTVLYLLFAILLGATCDRWYLQNDYMIAETVSLTGFLWLLGLYISSLSSCLGGLYGAPRILQCIANENVIPIIRFLGHGKGPNKEPVIAQLLVCFIAILFIFIGQVNYLGPIVTMPFLLSYAGIDYAYFSLAMSFDRVGGDPSRKEKDSLLSHVIDKNREDGGMSYGALVNEPDERRDSLDEFKKDIEKAEKAFGVSPAARKEGDNEKNASLENGGSQYGGVVGVSDKESLISNQDEKEMKGPFSHEITRMPPSWYSRFCNRWVSLIGAVVSVAIMFAIQWGYALANVCVYLIVYIYIGQANPGVKPGIADFQFFRWIKSLCQRLFRATPPPAQMVLTPIVDNLGMRETSINQDNEDFADRHRFHHSSVVNGNSFVEDQPLSAIHAPDSESEEEIFTGGAVDRLERNSQKEKGLVKGEIEPLLQDRDVTQGPDI